MRQPWPCTKPKAPLSTEVAVERLPSFRMSRIGAGGSGGGAPKRMTGLERDFAAAKACMAAPAQSTRGLAMDMAMARSPLAQAG